MSPSAPSLPVTPPLATRLDGHFARAYGELCRRAERLRAGWHGADTMNATALVHEAYEKMAAAGPLRFESEAHFLAVAARAMRQVLLDYAKGRRAQKRGGGAPRVPLGEHADGASFEQVLALDEAVERLRAFDPEGAEVVTCRFYAGLSVEETAAALALSAPTVKRRWRAARAWLYRELGEPVPPEPEPV